MNDHLCVQFLQWALPRLHMRWMGFRKVRKQICKRIQRRISELGLTDVGAYRSYLESTTEEWTVLDGLCRVTVSRFYRNRQVFAVLQTELLPRLAHEAQAGGEHRLRLWSTGCASGEEPYTLALLWRLILKSRFPQLDIHILATDSDPNMLRRARMACYPAGSVKELPKTWRNAAFVWQDRLFCLRSEFKADVVFVQHDVRADVPEGPFHVILCRNLAFTYFDRELQLKVARQIRDELLPGGVLITGVYEALPEGVGGFAVRSKRLGIYEKNIV